MNTLTGRLKGLLILGVVITLVVMAGPTVLKLFDDDWDRGTYETTTYEGMVIQHHEEWSAEQFANARRRSDQALVLVQWKGARVIFVDWHRTGVFHYADEVPPMPNASGISTWGAIITGLHTGDLIGVSGAATVGRPPPGTPVQWTRCVIIHGGAVVREQVAPDMVNLPQVACDYLIP